MLALAGPIRAQLLATMNASDASDKLRGREKILVFFGFLQFTTFATAIAVIAYNENRPNPWPIIVAFGVGLGQCALVAAFAVFSSYRLIWRMITSALLVELGGLTLLVTDWPRVNARDLVIVTIFSQLLWLFNQTPLWLYRLLVGASVVRGDAVENLPNRSQYGTRQLMLLMLAVSLTLGFARLLLPFQAVQSLKEVRVVDWIIFSSIGVGVGLIVTTTTVTALHPVYWRTGVAVSLLSSVLLACGIYSTLNQLNFGLANERIYFAVMLLVTYAWLQISVLAVRVAGYRIVVGSSRVRGT